MNQALTTTAFALDGYRIVQNKGVVRGIIVRSRSIFGTIGGSLQTLVGGNISLFTGTLRAHPRRRFQSDAPARRGAGRKRGDWHSV
jgi:uncharacterized protein YbjQ (UPF0145 family)